MKPQLINLKIYRNLPFVDQTKEASFIKRIFPLYFRNSTGYFKQYVTIEIPFIGIQFQITKHS